MVEHLNVPGMHKKEAYKAKYRIQVTRERLFPDFTVPMRHSALKAVGTSCKKYNSYMNVHPDDLEFIREEAANVRKGGPGQAVWASYSFKRTSAPQPRRVTAPRLHFSFKIRHLVHGNNFNDFPVNKLNTFRVNAAELIPVRTYRFAT